MSAPLADHLMGNPDAAIAAVRNQVANAFLFAITLIGLPVLATSLYRAKEVGWQPVMSFQIGLYLVVLGATVIQRRLSFRIRAFIVLGVFFSLGVSSTFTWGLIGPGILGFTACSIAAVALFGSRSGIVATVLGALVVAVEVYICSRSEIEFSHGICPDCATKLYPEYF